MSSLLRAIAAISFFGLLGPMAGFALFLVLVLATSSRPAHVLSPFPFYDFISCISEFGIPATISGIIFLGFAWSYSRVFSGVPPRAFRALGAALSFALVFCSPIVWDLATRGVLARRWWLFLALPTGAGLLVGLVLPKSWLLSSGRPPPNQALDRTVSAD